MELNKYQEQAMTTCMESSNNVAYMFLNLMGEVGELAEKMADGITDKAWKKALTKLASQLEPFGQTAKNLRKYPDSLVSADIRIAFERLAYITDETRELMEKEVGDIMWQLNGLITVLGMSAELIAQQNLDKLSSRQERGKIDGDGDNR